MSQTRRAKAGAPLSQERFMSSEEFAELRGIKGMPTATKAALVKDPEHRRLIYWLQQKSLEPGGLDEITSVLIEVFPEQLGTPTMHKLKLKPGMKVKPATADRIEWETRFIDPEKMKWASFAANAEACDCLDSPAPWAAPKSAKPVEAEVMIEMCRQALLAKLPDFLIQLCVNPFITPAPITKDVAQYEAAIRARLDGSEIDSEQKVQPAEIVLFRDLVPCLVQLMNQECHAARRRHALTTAGQQIWKTLDFCLRTRELVVIQGREGIGKTEGVKAWCAVHAGQVRYVSLASTNSASKFFREVSRACGLGSSYGYKSSQMEARVIDFLRRSGQMLVVDEGHYLLPQVTRACARPVLLDFLYSALNNHGVPVALVCTPQFSLLASNVERRTGWNADQYLRRAKRFIELPVSLPVADLHLVARALLPDAAEALVKVAAAYAAIKEHQLDAVKDLVREARMIAEDNGRDCIKTADLEAAMREVIEPTLLAKVKAMGRLKTERQGGIKRGAARPMQAPCNVAELPLQRGATMAPGRGVTPGTGDAEEEFADAPALAG